MEFREALANYIKVLPGITPGQSMFLLKSINKVNIPVYCILVGIHYFQKCLNNSLDTYQKLAASIYLGYRLNKDRYVSVKNWSGLTFVDQKSIVFYESQILRVLKYSVQVNHTTITKTLSHVKKFGQYIAILPTSPVSPCLTPRASFPFQI